MPKGRKSVTQGSEDFIYMCPCEYQIIASSDREINCKVRLHQKRCRLDKKTFLCFNDTSDNYNTSDTQNKHLAIEAFNKINIQQLKF
jgi:hypothetical protein